MGGLVPSIAVFERSRTGQDSGVPTAVDLDEAQGREDGQFAWSSARRRVEFTRAMHLAALTTATDLSTQLVASQREWFRGRLRKSGTNIAGSDCLGYLRYGTTVGTEDRRTGTVAQLVDVTSSQNVDMYHTGPASPKSNPTNGTRMLLVSVDLAP